MFCLISLHKSLSEWERVENGFRKGPVGEKDFVLFQTVEQLLVDVFPPTVQH